METWIIIDKADTDERDRLMALALARDTYNIRLDLLSSSTVVERAVQFVENHKSYISENHAQKSNNHSTFDSPKGPSSNR